MADRDTHAQAATARRQRVPNRRGQGDRLRTELVTAASELLEELGSEEALSLRAVARRANVAPQSVYLQFAEKRQLIAAVFEERFAELVSTLMTAAATGTDPRSRLRAICRAYCDYALQRPGHYRVLFGTTGSADWQPHELRGQEAFALVEQAVRAALTDGHPDPGQVAICLWASLHGLVTLRLSRPSFPWPDLDELLTTALDAYTGTPPRPRTGRL